VTPPIAIVEDQNPENKDTSTRIGIVAGVVSGCAVSVTTTIIVGFALHNHGHHLFKSAREMLCENDLGDGEDDYDHESSDEKEIFDVEARGYGNSSTDGSAEWRKLGIHGREDSTSYFDCE
jgi:hypothetical protein